MGGLWTSYMDAGASQRIGVLREIAQTTPNSISTEDRKGLVQNILDDIDSKDIPDQDLATALLAVKTLARIPEGSAVIVKPSNLKLLHRIASPSAPTQTVSEALRCIANALLLVESGRDAWLEVGGGKLCLQYLQDPKTNEEFCFLNGRILFLSTLKQCEFLKNTVEDEKIMECIADRCETLLEANVASKPFAKDALTDVLKFIFNLLLQYPRMIDSGGEKKVMGEQWSEKFEILLLPLVHAFIRLPATNPPLVSPLTHVIHALLNVPVLPYASIFFPTPISSTSSKLRNGFTSMSSSVAAGLSDPFQRAMSLLSSQRKNFQASRPDAPRRSNSASGSNSPHRSSSSDDVNASMRARSSSPSMATPARASTPPSKGDSSKSPKHDGNRPSSSKEHKSSFSKDGSNVKPSYLLVTHACTLLDNTLSEYWPADTEADAPKVRSKAIADSINLDEAITPLVVLLARLAADTGARMLMREWILPADLDRTTSLEGRADCLGRCIRLLASVYYTRLKDAVGEWLFTLCDSDASVLSAQIGYGNAAGYLFNKGILSGPPPPVPESSRGSSSTSVPENINPITGMVNREVENDGPEMTDEEKEREAERLFVLFDRLERSGMVQNPVRQAIQEGKLSMGPFGP